MDALEKTEYTVGDPFSVIAKLQNKTDKAYWFETGQVLIYISIKPAGIETDMVYQAILNRMPIKANDTITENHLFCGFSQDDPRGQDFLVDGVWQKAGEYTLEVTASLDVYGYTGSDVEKLHGMEAHRIGTLTLEPVTITVR